MIAPCPRPGTVSGPKSLIRPEKFKEGLQKTRPVRPEINSGRTVPTKSYARSGNLDLRIGLRVARLVELERPHLDQRRVQLTLVGELVGVRDALVVDRREVRVQL